MSTSSSDSDWDIAASSSSQQIKNPLDKYETIDQWVTSTTNPPRRYTRIESSVLIPHPIPGPSTASNRSEAQSGSTRNNFFHNMTSRTMDLSAGRPFAGAGNIEEPVAPTVTQTEGPDLTPQAAVEQTEQEETELPGQGVAVGGDTGTAELSGGSSRARGGYGGRRRGFGRKPVPEGCIPPTVQGYVPPPFSHGPDKFLEHGRLHSRPGINFDAYEDIPIEVKGPEPPPKILTFDEAKFHPFLDASIKQVGYHKPTPIQRQTIPALLAKRDVLASAENGSGKTAAFLLPLLNHLVTLDLTPLGTFPATPEALILAPTRELAIQIGREAHLYAGDSAIKTMLMYGGTSLYDTRTKIMEDGVNVLVCTPGRLRQFLGDEFVDLSKVQFFVMDEADKMLDMGFMPDIRALNSVLPPKEERVSAMFSATFPLQIRSTASSYLKDDNLFISVGVVGGACKEIVQEFELIKQNRLDNVHYKYQRLVEIANSTEPEDKIVVFCNTRLRTDILATRLSMQNISSTSIHGDRSQKQREEALGEFREGLRKILVTTPVSARGIDIPVVTLVVNFDLPTSGEEHYYQFGKLYNHNEENWRSRNAREAARRDHPLGNCGPSDKYWAWKAVDEYVHRIGRTGRVGHSGHSYSFFELHKHANLAERFVEVLKDANQDIPEWMLTLANGGNLDLGNPTVGIDEGDMGYAGPSVHQEKKENKDSPVDADFSVIDESEWGEGEDRGEGGGYSAGVDSDTESDW